MSLDADSYIGVHRGCGSACEINSLHTALCKVYMKALHPRLHGICNWLNACADLMKYNVFCREKNSKQKKLPVNGNISRTSTWYCSRNMCSCCTEIRRSVSLNSYGMFQPKGPNFLLSWVRAWKKHRPYNSFLNTA